MNKRQEKRYKSQIFNRAFSMLLFKNNKDANFCSKSQYMLTLCLIFSVSPLVLKVSVRQGPRISQNLSPYL